MKIRVRNSGLPLRADERVLTVRERDSSAAVAVLETLIAGGGAAGPQGPAGADGANGAQGPAGAKGDKGDKGDAGSAGAQGIQGIQGPAGADGAQGPAGQDGAGWQFPVGYILISTADTNPQTFLGYGTWSAFGAGRVLVGLDAGQTEFDAAEETGGAKTVTLTAAQSGLPQHTHLQDAHSHTIPVGATDDTSAPFDRADAGSNTAGANATAATGTATAVNQNAGPTDAAQAHSNLQPYVVVRFWKRTA